MSSSMLVWSWRLLTIASVVLTKASSSILPGPYEGPNVLPTRGYVTEANIAGSYDFVIVGGGLAGLVLAARLTENENLTVLVLEAGDSGDAVSDRIDTPSGAYYSSLLYTPYDWQYRTLPQPQAGNRAFDWPRGKVLGGSSAVNAMYLVRPSKLEIDLWGSLMAGENSDIAKNWAWDRFYAAMKKSETFIPPRDDVAQVANISWSASTHGTNGPMQVSYPGIVMSQVGGWATSLDTLGLPPLSEPNGGITLGSLIGPSWINPTNWTRSYSKAAYLDPVLSRSNLAVLVSSTATRIIFGDGLNGLHATGIEFATSRDGPSKVVTVGRELILSGGVVGSPQLLMVSGIGPEDVLNTAGVAMKVNLPGVGQHLQDHLTAAVVWASTNETAGDIYQSGSDFARSKEFLSFVNSATAWANLTNVFGTEGAESLREWVSGALEDSARTLVPSQYLEVVEGYKAIYDTIANHIMSKELAVVELLLATNTPGQVGVQAAIQHPLSQGRLYINTSSIFDAPVIDPQYFTHPADLTILRQGIKLVRSLKQVPPFNYSLGDEVAPGASVATDEQVEAWLINQAGTQYHPIASCAMLPRSQSGVVDTQLKVYGLANVRVVDSSVFPFEFASHVGSSTYGLAEQAASIILASINLPTEADGGQSATSRSTHAHTSPTLMWPLLIPIIAALDAHLI